MSGFLIQTPETSKTIARPTAAVAVVMRRESLQNQWQPWRWVLVDVIPAEPEFGNEPQCVRDDGQQAEWLFPGHQVELHLGDAEGYYLNATTEQPCFWVVWRLEEEAGAAAYPLAVPQTVTLSYHDAGRWLDAQESVEQVPAPGEIVQWLRAFVDKHHTPEPKRRQRPQSFQSLQDRFGNPVRVSTEKPGRSGGGHG